MSTTFLNFQVALTRQRGVTLIVAVILLLLLSVIVLLATSVGLQEQRTSSNDLRAKMAHYAAEAGLNYAGEYIKQNVGELRNDTLWEPCPNDDTFPCGVFPNAAAANLQRYIGDMPLSPTGSFDASQLGVGNFQASVRVGAVICRVADDPAGLGSVCSNDLSIDGSTVLSMVSSAQIAGESSSATLVQSITSFSKLNNNAGLPPIAASGSIAVAGSLDIVTNSNAGGTGVPVSVWTRRDVTGDGTPNTCYLDEFVRFGGTGGANPRFCNAGTDGCTGDNVNVLVCDDCKCPTDQSLSFNPPGGPGLGCKGEGIDVLDIDGDCGPNKDVVPEEFPCDLFEFVFGVKVREDLLPAGGDFFCETLIKADDPDDPGTQVGVDELWLRQNANMIIVATIPAGNTDSRLRTCAALGPAARGLIWIRTDCNTNAQVGTVDGPAILVVDGQARFQGGFRLFGMLFVRALGDVLDPLLGGDATLKFTGRGAIYGAAVVQGVIGNPTGGPGLTGTAAFIHNDTVLRNLLNLDELQAFGTMPGAWTDRFSY